MDKHYVATIVLHNGLTFVIEGSDTQSPRSVTKQKTAALTKSTELLFSSSMNAAAVSGGVD